MAKMVSPMVNISPKVMNCPEISCRMPGWVVSASRWWLQTPIDTSRSKRITVRTTDSPKSLRPTSSGTSRYQVPAVYMSTLPSATMSSPHQNQFLYRSGSMLAGFSGRPRRAAMP